MWDALDERIYQMARGETSVKGWVGEGLKGGLKKNKKKSVRTSASAEQRTGRDVLLLGSASRRFVTVAEKLHLPFHPPTPTPLPLERT